MEIILCLFSAGFVLMVGYYIMKESDETKRRKEFAAERVRRMQREREVQAEIEYERQRAKGRPFAIPVRSAPITTGKLATTTRVATPQVSRRDNSFDFDVDTYSTPTYHSSHSSGSSYSHSGGHSSHSCSSSSSSSSDSSSSSSDSGGGGCD